MGQCSAEYLSTFDIIMRKVRNSNIFFEGILILFSIDHLQIQPISGVPFLTSCHIVPCFKMVLLEHFVRAANDEPFKRIQEIARCTYEKIEEEPTLIDEFIRLCSEHFTFVDSWDDVQILPSTMRLYSKKVPAKDAARQFVQRLRRAVPAAERVTKQAEDVQKSRFSHQDWRTASEAVSNQLEQKLKDHHDILFLKVQYMRSHSIHAENSVTHNLLYFMTFHL